MIDDDNKNGASELDSDGGAKDVTVTKGEPEKRVDGEKKKKKKKEKREGESKKKKDKKEKKAKKSKTKDNTDKVTI